MFLALKIFTLGLGVHTTLVHYESYCFNKY
jgi:hypothetical protein